MATAQMLTAGRIERRSDRAATDRHRGEESFTHRARALLVLAICFVTYICDGMDIAAIAYAAPALMKDWKLAAQTMGLVLSAGTAGLAVGASVVAVLADRLGRRTVIVCALFEVAAGMVLAAGAPSVGWLILLRFCTGVGVGALVPTLNVLIVELTVDRRGSFLMSIGHVGYSFGMVLGAAIGAAVIGRFGWQAIFLSCGFATLAIALISLFLLPESVAFLLTRQPRAALARVNRILAWYGRPTLAVLPPAPTPEPRRGWLSSGIFAPERRRMTPLLWLVGFSYYFTAFFLFSWLPQILVTAGLSTAMAISSGVATGIGGALGALSMGALSIRFEPRRATCIAFVATAVCLILFAVVGANVALLMLLAATTMFASQASYTGSSIVAARAYPVAMRTTGIGLMVSVGRLGAVAGPYVAGVLIGAGWTLAAYTAVFAAVCILGATAILPGRVGALGPQAPKEPE